MKKNRLIIRIIGWICLLFLFFARPCSSAFAYDSATLHNGSRGEEVHVLQQALIDLGYLKGTADGVFGNRTENAVRAFQKKNRLEVDGLAGNKTREQILRMAEEKFNPKPTNTAKTGKTAKASATPKPSKTPVPTATPKPNGNLFNGDYTAIRFGNRGDRVKLLQNALISVGCMSAKADGIFGNQTLTAVKQFQRSKKLSLDGVAGRKTLAALEKAYAGTSSTPAPAITAKPSATPTPLPSGDLNNKISPPKVSGLKLLHWFNDVKPSLSGGQKLLIYDPASGLSWTLKIIARGRHCDAEPLSAKDTRTMVAAFGGVNTWNQKPVYVKLPDGRWTIGSTHDMPHQSGSIKDNNFDGHLCVHFLRDMDETKKNDPSYGVANQETIRKYWKKWTGEEIKD